MFKNKNILVAGGSGFIGRHFIKRFLDEGAYVRGTHFTSPPPLTNPRLEFIQADLRNPEKCAQVVEDMDYVIMCAANTSGAAVIRKTPLAHITPNVTMNTYMLEAAHRARIKKFCFLSSGTVYPPTGHTPAKEPDMLNGEPYEAYYAAAWMKRYAEILCRTYSEHIPIPMKTVVIRPSNVYGPKDKFDFKKSHVTAALVRRVVERHDPLEVWGTGEDIRDLIYIDDFIEGCVKAISHDAIFFTVNVCAGVGHSIKQVLEIIIEIDGFMDANVVFDPSKPTTIPILAFDNSLARDTLGFTPQISLQEGLQRTLSWYRENPFQE